MKLAHSASLALLLMASGGRAAETPEQLERVSVERRGASTVMPYGAINRTLLGIQQYGEGLVRMEFRVAASDPKQPLVAPSLALAHADFYRPLPIAEDGLVRMPPLSVLVKFFRTQQ